MGYKSWMITGGQKVRSNDNNYNGGVLTGNGAGGPSKFQ